MKFDITTLEGKSAGSVELSDEVFGLEPRADLLARMVRYQLAKRRAGTHKSKGRSEVDRTRKKIYKQKGTGGARHGAASAPQFRGGGKAFGPVVRDHAHDLPKKVKALALRHALSAKAKDAGLIIIDDAKLAEPKTKILLGQETAIDGDRLTMADLAAVQLGVKIWDARVKELTPAASGSSGGGIRIREIIPR